MRAGDVWQVTFNTLNYEVKIPGSTSLDDLNELLDKNAQGKDFPQDFQDFMDKHGDFFPENPQNLDELMDTLAQRSAAAQRMLNSMTPEQRAELMELSAQAFGSPQLGEALAQLDANLRVTPSPALFADLKALLGPGCLDPS